MLRFEFRERDGDAWKPITLPIGTWVRRVGPIDSPAIREALGQESELAALLPPRLNAASALTVADHKQVARRLFNRAVFAADYGFPLVQGVLSTSETLVVVWMSDSGSWGLSGDQIGPGEEISTVDLSKLTVEGVAVQPHDGDRIRVSRYSVSESNEVFWLATDGTNGRLQISPEVPPDGRPDGWRPLKESEGGRFPLPGLLSPAGQLELSVYEPGLSASLTGPMVVLGAPVGTASWDPRGWAQRPFEQNPLETDLAVDGSRGGFRSANPLQIVNVASAITLRSRWWNRLSGALLPTMGVALFRTQNEASLSADEAIHLMVGLDPVRFLMIPKWSNSPTMMRFRNRMFFVYGWGANGEFAGLSLTLTSRKIAGQVTQDLQPVGKD